MDDRPTGLASGLRAAPVAALTRPRGLGLSWKLLCLTVLFVMASEVLIYVPSIANFRSSWLADRLTMADTAALVIVGGASTWRNIAVANSPTDVTAAISRASARQ